MPTFNLHTAPLIQINCGEINMSEGDHIALSGWSLAILIFLFAVTSFPDGCASAQVPDSSPQTLNELQICNVAVLPFVNETEYNQGDVIFYRIFTAELHKVKGLSISQEGDVRKIYRQMRLDVKQTPDLDQLLILGDRLGGQAFIMGKILKMSEKKGSMDAQPLIAVNLRLVNAVTGKIIRTIYLSRTGEDFRKIMHFGLVNTITELASLLSDEIARKWFKEGGATCP